MKAPAYYRTAAPAHLAHQWASFDRQMAEMEERYRDFSGGADEKPAGGAIRPAPLPIRPDYEAALTDAGRVVEAGDADEDLTAYDAEMNDLETLQTLRETGYVRHVKNRAGDVIEKEAFENGYKAREQLRDDTLEIALRLQAVGRRSFADKKNPVGFIVCPLTGRFHVLPNVMGRKIFPTVAAQKRARMVAALELILRQKGHEHDQFITFTSGKRCPVGELRERFQKMHRKLSKLNGADFMRHFGARFIWRSSEIGGLLDDAGKLIRNEAGEITFHPHAHVLMHLDRWLPPRKMRRLTRCIDRFWGGAWWQIDGRIEKIREACKYVGKPAELRKLNGFELADLDTALFRLHLVQPLGELREQIRSRRESCLTIKRERRVIVDDDGTKRREVIPVVLPDWNARKRDRKPDKTAKARAERRKAYRAKADEIAAKMAGGKWADTVEWQADLFADKEPERLETADSPRPLATRPVVRNRVVARLSPAPYFDRVLTPALLIWNFDAADLEQIQNLPFVRPALEAVRARIEQARASLRDDGRKVSVHTSPITVRDGPPGRVAPVESAALAESLSP